MLKRSVLSFILTAITFIISSTCAKENNSDSLKQNDKDTINKKVYSGIGYGKGRGKSCNVDSLVDALFDTTNAAGF